MTRGTRIAVWGAGGIGGYFGGLLAAAGNDVSFIARGAHLDAMRADGLHVESVDGDFHVAPGMTTATDDPGEIGPVDYVILAVKTWQLPEVVDGLGPLLGPDTAVVTTQNGVDAPGAVAAVVGQDRVMPGIAKVFSEVAGPGRIRHAGGPGSLAFAEWDATTSARVKDLRSMLAPAGVALEEPPDIWVALWIKFLFVVPLGGLGAVARAPVGVVRSQPGTRALLTAGMGEIRDLGLARRIGFPDEIVDLTLGLIDQQPPAGQSSLQRDIAAGKPSELDAWSGAVHPSRPGDRRPDPGQHVRLLDAPAPGATGPRAAQLLSPWRPPVGQVAATPLAAGMSRRCQARSDDERHSTHPRIARAPSTDKIVRPRSRWDLPHNAGSESPPTTQTLPQWRGTD